MSSKQESDINHSLPEHHKSWKSRLHRFQSSLRRSVRPRKGSRQRPTTEDAESRLTPSKENENHRLNRSFGKDRLHARREISSHEKHTAVSTKQGNGPKTSSHNNCVNGKTSVDRWSLDKRKFERSKPICNNNSAEKQNLKDRSPNAHSSELSEISQSTSNGKKRRQKVKLQRVNVNTERTSISKSKSLSILTNLFKRSSLSKEKDNRGKNLSNWTSQSTVSKSLSTVVSTDFDSLSAGDYVLSSSSIDSFTDCDRKVKRVDKYYSLKRSRGALIFPKNNLFRTFSLDTSLDPDNQPMEKSRTLAAIPPCIRVEEFRDNCGFWERSLTAEFFHDSSGSVTIDAGTEYYQRLTASSSPLIPVSESEVNLNSSSGGPENGEDEISSRTASNITQEAEKSNGMLRRQTAPPSLSFYSVQTSANGDIGGPSFSQGEGYIVTHEEGPPLAVSTRKSDSKGSVNNVCSANTSEQKYFVDFKSDMGNNVSHAEKARKASLGEAKLIRHKKKHSQYSTEDCSYGEASPIVLEGDFLECFEQEIGDEEFNYRLVERKGACGSNGRTIIEKSSSLCTANEPLADSEKMINGDQENYSVRNWSDVKHEIDACNKGEVNADKECIFNGAKHFSNGKVNTLQEACDVDFCSETFEQAEQNEYMRENDCLYCTTTRREMTDTELMERPSELSVLSLSKKTDLGSLNELLHKDHVNQQLITGGLPEIHNGKQGLAEKCSQSPKVNSLPNSPFSSSTPAQAFHNSYPDIATMHLSQHSNDSSKSFFSSDQQVENSLESSCSLDSREMSTKSPLSLDLSKCKRNGEVSWSHLSPETTEERLRSCSTGIPSRSPLHQVLLTENRSASCTQLDQKEEDNLICSSPPYVRPRVLSLEELPPCTAEVVLRKKRNIIKKNRVKHAASLPFVDHILDEVVDKSKRHSYGGYGDILFLQLPHLLQRSMSAEGQLDSCNSSVQSINSVSSLTESELGSTMSVTSDLSTSSAFDKNLGRSRSVPGHLGITDIPQTSPIPEEQSSVTESQSNSIQDSDDEDDIGEMDVPEAFAEALWDHVTMDPEELSFQAGDIITVLAMTSCEWWFGQVKDRVGWFPAPFVRVRVSQTLAADETKLAAPVRTRKGTNEGFLSDAVVRSRVVEEILNTERDYVKNLKDVVEGYLKQARRRTDMFTEDQITTIFSNIEQIYHFHQEILKQLEECYVKEDPFASEIGVVFLKNKHGFEIYSEYCNNHPHAMAELKTLCESNKYKQFFEACRLLQEMINISFDGFLLTPVQKICKYPLQLAELKKHTKPNHKDFQSVKHALDTMREVASLINERKRKVESIHKIAKWQSTIEGWEGEDVLERSSELIHSGDVVKVSNGSSQDRVMFLFDHQLIFCKKDILKKNGLTYKGRIFVDDCTVQEDNNEKSTLQNTWKIYNRRKERWYIFHTKKVDDKELWLSAFQEERQRVSEDARSGLIISQKTRKAAMRAAQSSVKHKKLNGKKDKLQKSQSTVEIKPPPSPTLKLPEPVSSADLRDEDEDEEEQDTLGLRSSVSRRSFGLRGSTKKNKEKRISSFF